MARATTSSTPAIDVAAVKNAISAARSGSASQATDIQERIQDPVARKLVEWAILRSDSNGVELRPLHRLHQLQPELAKHRLPAPPR